MRKLVAILIAVLSFSYFFGDPTSAGSVKNIFLDIKKPVVNHLFKIHSNSCVDGGTSFEIVTPDAQKRSYLAQCVFGEAVSEPIALSKAGKYIFSVLYLGLVEAQISENFTDPGFGSSSVVSVNRIGNYFRIFTNEYVAGMQVCIGKKCRPMPPSSCGFKGCLVEVRGGFNVKVLIPRQNVLRMGRGVKYVGKGDMFEVRFK